MDCGFFCGDETYACGTLWWRGGVNYRLMLAQKKYHLFEGAYFLFSDRLIAVNTGEELTLLQGDLQYDIKKRNIPVLSDVGGNREMLKYDNGFILDDELDADSFYEWKSIINIDNMKVINQSVAKELFSEESMLKSYYDAVE